MPAIDPIAVADILKDAVHNHCPFGCSLEELDDHGYCSHLVGFINHSAKNRADHGYAKVEAGLEYEPIGELQYASLEEKGKRVNSGRKMVYHVRDKAKRPQTQDGDVLVNPESHYVDQGVAHTAKQWVSSRVYRPAAEKAKKAS